jgi:hypothetical protein
MLKIKYYTALQKCHREIVYISAYTKKSNPDKSKHFEFFTTTSKLEICHIKLPIIWKFSHYYLHLRKNQNFFETSKC